MEYEIKYIATDDNSLVELQHFLKVVFPRTSRFTLDFLRWQYKENPLGEMEGFNAWHNGRIISHFAGLPIEMNLFDKKRRGLLCINVSTDPKYQGKKLFKTLGERTVKYAMDNGYDFMIAVPNANSSHTFLKYLGFYLISPLSVKVGIGNNIFSDRHFDCYKSWDEKQYKWRLNSPVNKYSCSDGCLYSPISFFAKTISKINLFNKTVEELSQNIGFRPLNLYVGLGADISRGFYFNMPSFIKRPPFNLVFKDFTGEIPPIQKENVFIQLIDLDTI
ncbi:GNAT family N-acetyltransferase [Dysgonomonas massiliensis]|uniref:GNAT family N-acetyltransferase n=1 Tax=Dysgonomonas massiliensis TaxID=2040292 RepID=UPI000C7639CE|nr:GNAT family N-acetyltransferase [Dysgonomonas massiliensis]